MRIFGEQVKRTLGGRAGLAARKLGGWRIAGFTRLTTAVALVLAAVAVAATSGQYGGMTGQSLVVSAFALIASSRATPCGHGRKS